MVIHLQLVGRHVKVEVGFRKTCHKVLSVFLKWS